MFHLKLKILQTLHEEHLAMLALLERLEALLESHRGPDVPHTTSGPVAELLFDMERVMRDEISHHYAFEEGHLFPRFAAYADAGITMMLRGEHDAIRPVAARINQLASEALANGFTDATWLEFRDMGEEMVEREVFHVQKEEMGFLPGLNQMLKPEEDDALVAAYAALKAGS